MNEANNVLAIKLYGATLNGQMDARTAETIIDIQTMINRVARLAFFGASDARNHFSKEQRYALNLEFNVRPGCTFLGVDLSQALDTIIAAVAPKMTPQDFTELVKTVGGLLLAGYMIYSLREYLETKLQNEGSQHAIDKIIKIAEQCLIEMSTVVGNASRRFPDMTQLDWGRRRYNESELNSLRAPQDNSIKPEDPYIEDFIVQKIILDQRPTITVHLLNQKDNTCFKGSYSEDGELLGPDNRTVAIMKAAENNSTVRLRVDVKRRMDGEIVRVTILDAINS